MDNGALSSDGEYDSRWPSPMSHPRDGHGLGSGSLTRLWSLAASNSGGRLGGLEATSFADSLATDVAVAHVAGVVLRPYSVGVDDEDTTITRTAIGCWGSDQGQGS